MSVRHYLLPITSAELDALLARPGTVFTLTRDRADDVLDLDEAGPAIAALVAEGPDDPAALLHATADPDAGGQIGRGDEIDMGYGAPWFARDSWVRAAAERLRPITADVFAAELEKGVLDDEPVYLGGWHNPDRRRWLCHHFTAFKNCLNTAAARGDHLLIWCA